ncbi:hypothetical protein BH10PLA2_BH10PLA2_03640 [soil metagenome]
MENSRKTHLMKNKKKKLTVIAWIVHVFLLISLYGISLFAVIALTSVEPRLIIHQVGNGGLDCTPDGKILITTTAADYTPLAPGTTIRIWNTSTGRQLRVLTCKSSHLQNWKFSPDSRLLGVHELEMLRIWDLASGKEHLHLRRDIGTSDWFDFSPDSNCLLIQRQPKALTPNAPIVFYDIGSGQELHHLDAHWNSVAWPQAFQGMVFDASGNTGATLQMLDQFSVARLFHWNLVNAARPILLHEYGISADAVALAPDLATFVTYRYAPTDKMATGFELRDMSTGNVLESMCFADGVSRHSIRLDSEGRLSFSFSSSDARGRSVAVSNWKDPVRQFGPFDHSSQVANPAKWVAGSDPTGVHLYNSDSSHEYANLTNKMDSPGFWYVRGPAQPPSIFQRTTP